MGASFDACTDWSNVSLKAKPCTGRGSVPAARIKAVQGQRGRCPSHLSSLHSFLSECAMLGFQACFALYLLSYQPPPTPTRETVSSRTHARARDGSGLAPSLGCLVSSRTHAHTRDGRGRGRGKFLFLYGGGSAGLCPDFGTSNTPTQNQQPETRNLFVVAPAAQCVTG